MKKEKSKLFKVSKFDFVTAMVMTSLMILMMFGLVIGCSNQITKGTTEETPNFQTQIVGVEQFWVVEFYGKQNEAKMLEEYLMVNNQKVNDWELAKFIESSIGSLHKFSDMGDAEDFLKIKGVVKQTVEDIELDDGSIITIITCE